MGKAGAVPRRWMMSRAAGAPATDASRGGVLVTRKQLSKMTSVLPF
jgi:hypothetical protein